MLKDLREASKLLKGHAGEGNGVRVITHYDADGLTAGAILHRSLMRLGATVHTRSVRQLDSKIAREISLGGAGVVIFADMGSGQVDIIKELIRAPVIILDHHQPKEASEDGIVHINAHHYGLDGAREISGSGMTYLLAKALDPSNGDLSPLPIVGAVGDIQEENGKLKGANTLILGDAVNAGLMRVEKDLRLFGRQTRPLYKALEYTTEPFIPGLSGSESACVQFLRDLGIPEKKDGGFTRLADLDVDERQRLVTALILRMLEHKIPTSVAESIVGDVYTLLNEADRTPLRDAKEYATLLNACGKRGSGGLGIAVCLGDRGALYEKSLEMLKEHKGYISSCYDWISKNLDKIKDAGVLYHFHAGNEVDHNVIGTVASMVISSRLLKEQKPVVAFCESGEGDVKVSARCTREYVRNGLNLGKIMLYASEKIGRREGGGHDVAAGATISKGQEEEFLRYVKEEMERQLNAGPGKA